MAAPKFFEFFDVFLLALKDGQLHTAKEDQLGFSSIYIQAKQWSHDNKVSRPEIQKFAGALQGQKATKGLFITTSSFTNEAREFAENLHGSTIVLVDGKQMMKLMVKYNLGVSVEQTYEVKRIDSDFRKSLAMKWLKTLTAPKQWIK